MPSMLDRRTADTHSRNLHQLLVRALTLPLDMLDTDGSDMATYCGASHVDVILKCCSRDLDMLRGIKGQIVASIFLAREMCWREKRILDACIVPSVCISRIQS